MAKIKINLSGQDITLSVPEGMDPLEYANQVEDRHYAQEQPDASTGGGTLKLGSSIDTGIPTGETVDRLLAGAGRGMTNVARQAGNIVGLVSDEELGQSKSLDEDLMNTGAGKVGNFVGEMAATAPLAVGATGATALTRSMAARGSLPALAGRVAGPGTAAVLEGAGTGALLAGPGERMEGAALGAGISGALTGTGKVLKRALTKPWVTKTADATQLESMTGRTLPLTHATDKGSVARQIYEGVVANFLGVGGKLRSQYDDALTDFRHFVVEEATPPGMDRIIPDDGDMQAVMGALKGAWDQVYDFGFKEVPIVLGQVDNYALPRVEKKALGKLWPKSVKLPKEGDTITGSDVLRLKETAQQVINDIPQKEAGYIGAMRNWRESLDEVLAKNLDPTGKGKGALAKEFRRYKSLNPYYAKYQDIVGAANKALDKASEFSPKQLLKSSNVRAGGKGAAGGGALNEPAKIAASVLEDFSSKQGIFQTVAALHLASTLSGATAITGGLMGGPGGALVGAALPYAAARALASPRTQRALTGELPVQRALARSLRKIQKPAEAVGRQGRRAAVIGATEE